MLGNMTLMRRTYTDLYHQNQELLGEYQKRSLNHEQLLEALKVVNSMIQKAAKLRNGKFKVCHRFLSPSSSFRLKLFHHVVKQSNQTICRR